MIQQYAPGMELHVSAGCFTSPQEAIAMITELLGDDNYREERRKAGARNSYYYTSNARCKQLATLLASFIDEGQLWNKLP